MEEKQELSIDKGMELGEIFHKSGVFPDIKSAAQGYIKILAGRELGMSPMQSINSFYFVAGRIGIMSNAVSALIKGSDKYDYSINKHDEQECSITFYRIDDDKQRVEIGTSAFTFKDAAKAGIVNKDVWKNYPKNMLFSRALMNGVRWHCPDAISSTIYSVEELEDIKPVNDKKTVTIDTEGNVENGKEDKEELPEQTS